jgi:lysophospholipase L1-like esterase
MKNASKTIFALILYFVCLCGILELVTILYLRIQPSYDVAMWRYNKKLKIKADDPGMSHRHSPSSSAQLYGVQIKTNSHGLKDRDFSYDKSENVRRVLFLGDSLTLGWGVPFKDLFTKLLEKKLKDIDKRETEIINTGVGNYNTEQEFTYYKNEGKKFNPDHVMLLYFINDAEPTPKYSDPPIINDSYFFVFMWSRIKKFLGRFDSSNNFLNYYSNIYKENNGGWELSKKSLLAIKDLAKINKSKLTVAVCPELRILHPKYPFLAEHKKILSFLKSNNISHIDLLPIFQKRVKNENDVWVSLEDSHPNSLGNQIITKGITDYFLSYPEKL